MTRTFEITDEMIRTGSPESDTSCPIGLALKAGGVEPICVGFNFISCAAVGRVHTLPLPREASTFLRDHDAGKRVAPTRFSLTFLEEAPRPLPARLQAKSMPQAPVLPVSRSKRRLAGFHRTFASMLSLFSF
jgi:hypothetical protein